MRRILTIIGKSVLGLVVLAAVLFITLYAMTSGSAEVSSTVAQDPSIPHVTIDDVTFHAEAFGSPTDPVVIVVHGGPGMDYRYLLNLQELSDRYYVVFYDQRGTGLSPRVPREELTLENSIEDLNRIVEHHSGDRSVAIVGHSWGAMLAAAYISRYPDRVDQVVLAEPGMLTVAASEEVMPRMARMDLPLLLGASRVWFESLHLQGPDQQARTDYFQTQLIALWNYAPWNGYNCPGTSAPQDHAWRYSAASQNIIASAQQPDGSLDLSLLHEGLADYPNKVLLMVSECNTWIGMKHQENYHVGLFQDVELVEIPDAGHDMFYENPADSIAAVRDYLTEESRQLMTSASPDGS